MKPFTIVLFVLPLLTVSRSSAGTILTFADLTQSGTSIGLVDSPYTSQGFGVSDSSSQFLTWQNGSENYFGATALIPGFFDSITTLTRSDGGLFDLLSIDLAPLAVGITDPQTLMITGIFSDLSTVAETCSISAAPAFNTCSFGSQFTNLSSVTWGTEALFQYTNIELNADTSAPEPGTLGLLTLGLIGILLATRRSISSKRSLVHMLERGIGL